ncbi:MAG: hypothetical protein AB6733_04595 [Clostridiaceae bacterium]
MKKIIITATIFLGLLIVGGVGYRLLSGDNDGFDIEIKNTLNEDVSGLTITYKNITEDIALPTIKSGETYKLNITPKEEFNENQMTIYYKDKRGVTQKNTLIGYFEKGYSGEVKVTINSIDNNGLIYMRIENINIP